MIRRAKPAPASPGAGDQARLVTIDMVARAAEVSPSTVSRILNGTAVVSADKIKAVEQAIRELGYVPNPVARGLAGGRTLSVGVVTQTLDSPFYGSALRGIEAELLAAGYTPLFISGQWNEREEQHSISVLRARRVDGIIALDARLSDEALIALARDLPVVVTGRSLEAPNLASLCFDNFGGARQATDYLLDLGHRRIAFITGDPEHQDALERQRGYLGALAERGVAADPRLIIPGDYREPSGTQAVLRLLKQRVDFTAVFAANDQMALGALLGLYQKHVSVPQQVSVMGFDDLQVGQYSIPPLSSVHQPGLETGRLAARAMSALLEGRRPKLRMPTPRLVVRESTGRCAAP